MEAFKGFIMSKYRYHLEWFSIPGICRSKDKAVGVIRGYKKKGDPTYFGVATIVKRPDGLHEPLAWLTKAGSTINYHGDAVRFLLRKGLRVAWTFEVNKFALYKRLFRNVGRLKILKSFEKKYNNIPIKFHYGEIVPWKTK